MAHMPRLPWGGLQDWGSHTNVPTWLGACLCLWTGSTLSPQSEAGEGPAEWSWRWPSTSWSVSSVPLSLCVSLTPSLPSPLVGLAMSSVDGAGHLHTDHRSQCSRPPPPPSKSVQMWASAEGPVSGLKGSCTWRGSQRVMSWWDPTRGGSLGSLKPSFPTGPLLLGQG